MTDSAQSETRQRECEAREVCSSSQEACSRQTREEVFMSVIKHTQTHTVSDLVTSTAPALKRLKHDLTSDL